MYNIGVQKERMVDEDMYVLSSNGSVLFSPLSKPYPHKAPKCSDCAPLFMKVRFSFTCNFMVFSSIVFSRYKYSVIDSVMIYDPQ